METQTKNLIKLGLILLLVVGISLLAIWGLMSL